MDIVKIQPELSQLAGLAAPPSVQGCLERPKSLAITRTPVPLNFYRIVVFKWKRAGGTGSGAGTTRMTLHANNNNLVIKTEPNKCAFIFSSGNSTSQGSNKQGL